MVRSRKSNIVDIEEVAGVSLRKASNGSRARTGVFINNSSGYSSGATGAMTVDGADATAHFSVGSEVFKADGKNLGLVTSVTTNSVTIGGGTTSAVVDDDELFNQPQHFGVGTTNQSTCVNEYFDIIEHSTRGNKTVLIIQPSDRERFNLLSKMVSDTESANFVSIESLVSKGRVISFSDMKDGSMMLAHGISSDLSSSSVYVKGSAAPDSHIVKEIMPGAPVVTMTLGGVGQGLSIQRNLMTQALCQGWLGTQGRDCQTSVSSTTSTTVVVKPLNNRTTDLQSWGTYCFPKVGSIYLEVRSNEGESIKYAEAKYTSKTGDTFTFASGTGHEGTGKFVLADAQRLTHCLLGLLPLV